MLCGPFGEIGIGPGSSNVCWEPRQRSVGWTEAQQRVLFSSEDFVLLRGNAILGRLAESPGDCQQMWEQMTKVSCPLDKKPASYGYTPMNLSK